MTSARLSRILFSLGASLNIYKQNHLSQFLVGNIFKVFLQPIKIIGEWLSTLVSYFPLVHVISMFYYDAKQILTKQYWLQPSWVHLEKYIFLTLKLHGGFLYPMKANFPMIYDRRPKRTNSELEHKQNVGFIHSFKLCEVIIMMTSHIKTLREGSQN